MQSEQVNVTRRKLVSWIGVLSLFTMAGAAFTLRKSKKFKTVKMLTRDGVLVEVDIPDVAKGNKKISDKELQNWVKRG